MLTASWRLVFPCNEMPDIITHVNANLSLIHTFTHTHTHTHTHQFSLVHKEAVELLQDRGLANKASGQRNMPGQSVWIPTDSCHNNEH